MYVYMYDGMNATVLVAEHNVLYSSNMYNISMYISTLDNSYSNSEKTLDKK